MSNADLIAKLEDATGNERGLFLEAGRAVFQDRQRNLLWSRYCELLDAEAYESAARMLVPEGWRLGNLSEDDPKDGKATAHVVRKGADYGAKPDDRRWATAATPALALCIASLKAQDQSQ